MRGVGPSLAYIVEAFCTRFQRSVDSIQFVAGRYAQFSPDQAERPLCCGRCGYARIDFQNLETPHSPGLLMILTLG